MKTLELTLVRHTFTEDSTIGSLYIDNKFICFTLEDKDRKIYNSNPIEFIKRTKIYGQTAIPYGKYGVIWSYSPKFKTNKPRLTNVKGFESILIHEGNDKNQTNGCILVGLNFIKDRIFYSSKAMLILCGIIEKISQQGGTINITITAQSNQEITI
jgi:hypothetical protein